MKTSILKTDLQAIRPQATSSSYKTPTVVTCTFKSCHYVVTMRKQYTYPLHIICGYQRDKAVTKNDTNEVR